MKCLLKLWILITKAFFQRLIKGGKELENYFLHAKGRSIKQRKQIEGNQMNGTCVGGLQGTGKGGWANNTEKKMKRLVWCHALVFL